MTMTDPLIESIYARAAVAAGKSEAQLREMAHGVFATMLFHALQTADRPIWTVMQVGECGFYVEVNLPPDRRKTIEQGGGAEPQAAALARCGRCGGEDAEVVELADGRCCCPRCVAELAEEERAG